MILLRRLLTMLTLALLPLILLSLLSTAPAFAAGPVGNIAAGQEKSKTCAACHGPTGNESLDDTYPKLAGQYPEYLAKSLHEYRSGARQNAIMAGMAAPLSDEDIDDLSAYFASQNMSVGAADPALVARGEALFRGGKLDQGMPACTGCHSPTGSGNDAAGFPQLGGQHGDYVALQLTNFREGVRTNDGDTKIMRAIAEKLSNKDIAALSSYIQGLH